MISDEGFRGDISAPTDSGSGTGSDDELFSTPIDGSGTSPDDFEKETTLFGSTEPDTSDSSGVSEETTVSGVSESGEQN